MRNMMKRKYLVPALCLILAMFLTGCVRISADIAVSKDGKVDLSLLYALSSQMNDYSEDVINLEPSEEEEKEYEKGGWIFTKYSDSGYEGYTLEKKDVDISLLTVGNGGETAEGITDLANGAMFKLDDGVYTFDLEPVDLSIKENDQLNSLNLSIGGNGNPSSVGDYVDVMKGYCTVKITLPKKPISHNATSVSSDGKTLTWNLLDMPEGEHVHVEFTLPGRVSYALIGGIVMFLIAATVLLFVIRSNKTKERSIRIEE